MARDEAESLETEEARGPVVRASMDCAFEGASDSSSAMADRLVMVGGGFGQNDIT